ncbi:arylsulfatase [Bradyrhizobium acaciae]|uniref:arylsulfatase n=1 Tax=Bradyrhizobium acaciae TaxID=2683706 RepID=UPI001E48A8DB|nr:arylsulfatase [Bradyrhizobium acaciae]MCC8981772.1 arylsulfatase [Bradyrhizobium acaciae]
MKVIRSLGATCVLLVAVSSAALAQQVRGAPGSPSAVMTLPGLQLPAPTAPFSGAIQPNAVDSTPAWPPQVMPPANAPNVLLILTDDVGFGAPSTFGGVIPTPALDRVAAAGLRYTTFHTTALCSPTRSALLTGRNHHNVGFGNISELSTGYPGYNSIIPRETATLAAVLHENGYSTAWFGKDHNVPPWEASAAGPFTNWPIGQGFDYFYGFVGGDTSQWQPGNLFRNTTPIHPYIGKPGWNLITAMADDAIDHIRQHVEIAPGRPWFIHYAPGGTHAPHHPTKEWADRIEQMHLFDDGWEKLRERIFDNQKRLGVVPGNAVLPAWPADMLKRWTDLNDVEKKLFVRQANVYAAYLAYTDHEIGRVIDEVARLGQLDNTLIIYISGDNGSSAEGSVNGTPNEVMYFNGVALDAEKQMPWYNVWGTDQTYNHMAVGWTWAFGTPYRWTKQVASHFGGTRNGMAISWPAKIKDRGGIRSQFHHVIDIAPTILSVVGIPQPDIVDGIAQRPMDGVSMAYTFPAENKDLPSTHRTQYFEILGNRALYHDGWIASTTPPVPPWASVSAPRPSDVMNGYSWELYNLKDDPTQNKDLAKVEPAKLQELKEMFIMEGERNHVFPLNNSITAMVAARPGPAAGRRQFVYTGPSCCTQANAAPSILNRSFRITAEFTIPEGGADGMLVTQGGRFAGWGLYVKDEKPTFTMNLLNVERPKWQAREALKPGRHTVVFDFALEQQGEIPFGHGGTGVMTVDGQEAVRVALPHTTPFTFAWDETFDVGMDTGTPVDDKDYQVPFAFSGKIEKITVDLGEGPVSEASMVAWMKAISTRDVERPASGVAPSK